MLNVYLFQPQYKVVFNDTDQYWLPYSVGCLWAYASLFKWVNENFTLKDLFFARANINELVKNLEDPTLCGFSCYVWNEQYCLEVAEKIKEKFPNCKIVFGGPQVNRNTLKEYKFIDSVILGEGEKNFVKVLRSVKDCKEIESVYLGERITDLSELPSPYTTGVFDKIIEQNPGIFWQMAFETNRGCPFSCTFCDWGSLTYSKVKKHDLKKIEEEILWIKNHRISYIFMADANFGIFKDRDLEIARLLNHHLNESTVETINAQFTKNSNSVVIEIAKTLGRLCRGITLSVQSMSDKTLNVIKRKNMAINKLGEMFKLIQEKKMSAYSELILGMPEETLESWKKGITDLLEAGQHNSIEVWFTQILKNSEMASEKSIKEYGIKTTRVKDYMFIFNEVDDIPEYMDIVTETNSMSTEQMAEAYMYSWVIIQFHIRGYTQVLSKYARNYDISFQQFYNKLIENMHTSNILNAHYESIKKSITYYLRGDKSKSSINKGLSAHAWMQNKSFDLFYQNKEEVYNIGEKTFKDFFDSPNRDVIIFQRASIHDENVNYPIEKKLAFNYKEMKASELVTYSFDSDFGKNDNSYATRRTKSLKVSVNQL